ncbi:Zinc finger, CCHC-type [Senna tora]|uniref:Zinc finger, CCHC-type n=1 Tax=Senna tora TaxID=362788 RepID=A0A834XFE0_9FABA|nr:Zinc finger, CCHC-type [Senna tora]
MSIKPNRGQGSDQWAWKEDHKGDVRVKGAYRFLMRPRWMLELRGMEIGAKCVWCNSEEESAYHVLAECDGIKSVWETARFDCSSRYDHASFLECLSVAANAWSAEQWCWATVYLYLIWEERNKRKFNNECTNLERMGTRVDRLIDEVQIANRRPTNIVEAPASFKWEKPARSEFKINVDNGVDCNGNGTIGGIARDDEGVVQGVFVEVVYITNDPILLKAMEIRLGVEMARDLGMERITVECDARLVVEMLETTCSNDSVLNSVCREILEVIVQFQYAKVRWIPRLCNSVADYLVKFMKNAPCIVLVS